MAQLPYMISASRARKILQKIKEAPTPSKFTQNYLSTTLGFEGANEKAFVSYAKSLDFLDTAGIPTPLYKQFRNPNVSSVALGRGLIKAYKPLYERNERFYELAKPKLLELVCSETGLDHDNVTAKRITNTFCEVKKLAEFSQVGRAEDVDEFEEDESQEDEGSSGADQNEQKPSALGLSYNINLILPNTDDPKIFNAIFKSLKDNLL
jgi:uncharacterized protein DUF5343